MDAAALTYVSKKTALRSFCTKISNTDSQAALGIRSSRTHCASARDRRRSGKQGEGGWWVVPGIDNGEKMAEKKKCTAAHRSQQALWVARRGRWVTLGGMYLEFRRDLQWWWLDVGSMSQDR